MTTFDLRGGATVFQLPYNSDADFVLNVTDEATGTAVNLTGIVWSVDLLRGTTVVLSADIGYADAATGAVSGHFDANDLGAQYALKGHLWGRVRNVTENKDWLVGKASVNRDGRRGAGAQTFTVASGPVNYNVSITLASGGGGGGAVNSVNGYIGTVVLVASDVGAVAPGDLADVATSGDYADLSNTPAIPSITGLQPTSEKDQPSGYAGLDGSGKLASSTLPALAIGETFTVANEAGMLALTAQQGDIAIRTDLVSTFILSGTDPSVLGDWTLLATPTDAVLSVNGQTGVVVLDAEDVGAATEAQGALADSALQSGDFGTASLLDMEDVIPSSPRTLATPGLLSLSGSGTFFVEPGDLPAWDNYEIREPGQPIYDPVTDKWILVYAASNDTEYRVRALAVVSDDGITWTQHAQNPLTGTANDHTAWADDPYIVKDITTNQVWRDSSGRAVMVIEELDTGASNRGIELWRSGVNTLDDWTQQGGAEGRILDKGASGKWDDQDRTSPTCIFDGTRLVLLYEGRGASDGLHAGAVIGHVGKAHSDDEGATWTVDTIDTALLDPHVTEWAGIVPDSIEKYGDEWFLFTHNEHLTNGYAYANICRYRTTDAPADWDETSFTEVPGNAITHSTVTLLPFAGDPTRAMWVNLYGAGLELVDIAPGVIADIEADVATNAGDIATNTGDIGTLQGEMTGAEAAIDALEEAAGDWVRTDGQPDVVPLALAEVAGVGVRRIVTGSLIDSNGFDPGATAWDGTSDLDTAGGVELVFDWGAPTPGQLSGVVWGLPVSAPGTEIIGLRVIGLASTGGGALTDVGITIAVSDGVTFALQSGSLHCSADRSEVFLLLAEGLAVTDALNPGVAGTAGFLQFYDNTVDAPPTSVTFDEIQILERPTLATPAEAVTVGTLDGNLVAVSEGTVEDVVQAVDDLALGGTPDAHAASHEDGGTDELALDASQITTGTVDTARLGSGTASSSTFLRGDQTYATPASGGAWAVISDTTLGSDQASVSFTSLGSYALLELMMVARSTAGIGYVQGQMGFNSDTGANYNWARSGFYVFNGNYSANNGAANGATLIDLGRVPGRQINTDRRALIRSTIQSIGAFRPSVQSFGVENDSTNESTVGAVVVGVRTVAEDVTSMQLSLSSGDFVAGSRFVLLGRT